ncbi:MAG: SDR family NAD(P)-dependent oxidoreductase [Anaerolineales bacterium]|nr:SDR family NAD(P)-dependent oxidoreductase [Anaerolineales bacterium]
MNLANKTILLTGAAHGLGRELAHLLDREACSLYLIDRDAPELDSVKAALGRPAVTLTCDLGDPAQRRKLVADLTAGKERLDIVINCAGVGSHSSLSQMTADEVERVMQVNALAPLELIVGLRPLMPANGLVVNIGSVVGELRLPSIGLYAASKAALHAFTESLALEGVHTLLVILGPLRGTDFVRSIAHLRTGQPGWYRRLDVPVETAGRQIVQAMKRGRNRLVLPRWYPIVFFLARFFAPAIKLLSFSGGRHVKV